MNEIVVYHGEPFMRIDVDGVKRLRPAYMQHSDGPNIMARWRPELQDDELLIETIDGHMSIVSAPTE